MIVVEAEFATCGCVSGDRYMWLCISGDRYMCAIACKLFFPHIDAQTNSCTISHRCHFASACIYTGMRAAITQLKTIMQHEYEMHMDDFI